MLKNRRLRVAVKPPQNEEDEPETTCKIRWNDMPSVFVPLLEWRLPKGRDVDPPFCLLLPLQPKISRKKMRPCATVATCGWGADCSASLKTMVQRLVWPVYP